MELTVKEILSVLEAQDESTKADNSLIPPHKSWMRKTARIMEELHVMKAHANFDKNTASLSFLQESPVVPTLKSLTLKEVHDLLNATPFWAADVTLCSLFSFKKVAVKCLELLQWEKPVEGPWVWFNFRLERVLIQCKSGATYAWS
jgi:hypothetical protein